MIKSKNDISALVGSLCIASSILLFHVLLLAALGLLVFFFSGFINYVFWIFLGGCALIGGVLYAFFRYMKKDGGRAFYNVLSMPELKGKNVEIRLLGGLASVKIDGESNIAGRAELPPPALHQIEDPWSIRLKELMALSRMLEKDMITAEEYHHAKKLLLGR